MDVKLLVEEAKARFSHNSAKEYLKDKYESKLIIATQGGLWKSDQQTLTFLYSIHLSQREVVLLDTFGNPVKVNALELWKTLIQNYNNVMEEWHGEWKNLESKR